jgi:hypothetical protein
MKRIAIVLVTLVGCSSNGDIGISNQPVTCQSGAAGAANGTVTNATTHQSYSFGDVTASRTPTANSIALSDSSLAITLSFNCGSTAPGMYDVGADQSACPLLAMSTVSGQLQQIYGTGRSGLVIIDQNVGCLAGRYDITYGVSLDNGTVTDEGEVAGWFSVPWQ